MPERRGRPRRQGPLPLTPPQRRGLWLLANSPYLVDGVLLSGVPAPTVRVLVRRKLAEEVPSAGPYAHKITAAGKKALKEGI